MVRGRSRMKQADSAAHSSGRSGGDSRVLDRPAAGVLQKMPTATDGTLGAPILVTKSRVVSCHSLRRRSVLRGVSRFLTGTCGFRRIVQINIQNIC